MFGLLLEVIRSCHDPTEDPDLLGQGFCGLSLPLVGPFLRRVLGHLPKGSSLVLLPFHVLMIVGVSVMLMVGEDGRGRDRRLLSRSLWLSIDVGGGGRGYHSSEIL